MRPLVLDGPRGALSQLTFVPLAPLVKVPENRCFTTPHDGRWRRSRGSHGRLGPAHSDRVVGSRESDDSQNGAGLVAVASENLGGSGHCELQLRMARHVCKWATRGGERRNTAVYDKGISLGVCRTILGVSVNDAGSIFWWCARARRLVYSAAQRAQRAVSSLAQFTAHWQRPQMWIYAAAPHRTTKPSLGGVQGGRCPGGAEANSAVFHRSFLHRKFP